MYARGHGEHRGLLETGVHILEDAFEVLLERPAREARTGAQDGCQGLGVAG